MKNLFIVAVISALGLTGCASKGQVSPQDFASWCQDSIHCVTVTIANGKINVNPDPVIVPTPRGPRHWIIWYIATPGSGYVFVNAQGDRPVQFKMANTQFNPEDQQNGCYHFSNNQFPADGRLFLCIDRNSVGGPFPYAIKVTPVAGAPAVPVLDPSIINDGG